VENFPQTLVESLWKTLSKLWKTLVDKVRLRLSTGVIHRFGPLIHSLSTGFSTGRMPLPVRVESSFPQVGSLPTTTTIYK
jgi:hypothetical protein